MRRAATSIKQVGPTVWRITAAGSMQDQARKLAEAASIFVRSGDGSERGQTRTAPPAPMIDDWEAR
jgi:hypothetical protein